MCIRREQQIVFAGESHRRILLTIKYKLYAVTLVSILFSSVDVNHTQHIKNIFSVSDVSGGHNTDPKSTPRLSWF